MQVISKYSSHSAAARVSSAISVAALSGPKGELRGALLADGTSLRMPPHAAAALASYFAPGAHVPC